MPLGIGPDRRRNRRVFVLALIDPGDDMDLVTLLDVTAITGGDLEDIALRSADG
ncbi:hypothetical protein [Glycomyces sp. YM15]|uniref:hypothetical protein n=1 Tax=Glycomyces sp. YM15 TaxID=2800446 RepID=UPI00196359B7|nr:hypothetical protein [Glycomyces sp. YM15]